MGYNKKYKESYMYISENMFLEKPEGWADQNDHGEYDSLWRTSLGAITYKDKELIQSIFDCFRKFRMINKKGYKYQASRYKNRYQEDDVSRDQVILAFSAMSYLNNNKLLTNKQSKLRFDILSHIPYKLSRRFNMSPTMYFWVKSQYKNNKIYSFLYGLFHFIELLLVVPINKLIRIIVNIHGNLSQDEHINRISYNYFNKIKLQKWKRIIYGLKTPGYAFHLASWMSYTIKNPFTKLINKLLIWEVENSNLLIRLLSKDKIKKDEINKYKPMLYWRWSSRLDGWTPGPYRYLNEIESKYNVIDKDILFIK